MFAFSKNQKLVEKNLSSIRGMTKDEELPSLIKAISDHEVAGFDGVEDPHTSLSVSCINRFTYLVCIHGETV